MEASPSQAKLTPSRLYFESLTSPCQTTDSRESLKQKPDASHNNIQTQCTIKKCLALPSQVKKSPSFRNKKESDKKIELDFTENQVCAFCYDAISDVTHLVFRCSCSVINSHALCSFQFLTSNIQSVFTSLRCPGGCQKSLSSEQLLRSSFLVRYILPRTQFPRSFTRYIAHLKIKENPLQYFICPEMQCLGLINRKSDTSSQCLRCLKQICLSCERLAHSGIECKKWKSQQSKEFEQKFITLAKDKQYQKCPYCGRYIEKTQGCNNMWCVCKKHFCFRCGKKYKSWIHYFSSNYCHC